MSFGKGCKPSDPHKLAARTPIDAHPLVAGHIERMPPPSFSLASEEPERLDQGQTSACTAHALAAGCFIDRVVQFVPSPDGIYKPTRAIERAATTPRDSPLPHLADTGGQLADAIEVIGRYGVSPMTPLPTRNSDVDPATVNDEPNFAVLQQSATTLVVGAYGINPGDLTACAAAIAAGFPLYVAFYADSGFDAWAKGDAPYGAPKLNDVGGGHAVVVDGYRANADASRTWRLCNSWGATWGDDGACQVSDAFMGATWEIWALDLKVAT